MESSKIKTCNVYFNIDPYKLIEEHKKTVIEYLDGETTIKQSLQAVGIDCEFIREQVSYLCTRYDFNIINPLDINKLNKIKKPLETILKQKLQITTGENGADFSLLTENTPRPPVYFDFCNPQSNKHLTPSIGLDSNNKAVFIDFNKCPHLLIAGATGSGKSILLNSLICSLLLNNYPSKFRMVLIDPKRVEFAPFSALSVEKPYLRTPQAEIITDTYKAIEALNDACTLIENRYNVFELNKVKNIDDFNNLIIKSNTTPLEHVFIIIDELADLMLTSRYEVESYLVRIAQIGRACGVHLILATQRPTVNVITGLIKANITTRIALQVASIRDSITILDHKGAEQLRGKGDAVIKYPYQVEEIRFQTAYISNQDIKNIVDYWANFNDYEIKEG